MAVELFDHTADIVVFRSPLDEALWRLVDDERLEYTLTDPVPARCASCAMIRATRVRRLTLSLARHTSICYRFSRDRQFRGRGHR
jgi:hypothetical protein